MPTPKPSAPPNVGGRPTVYTGGKTGLRFQGQLTKEGTRRFRAAAAALAKQVKRPVRSLSHADIVEFLARAFTA